MSHNLSLKLAIDESSHAALLRHPLLRKATEKHHEQLVSIYYDTRTLRLRREAILLRLRKQGSSWTQAVTQLSTSQGGLTAQPESSIPYRNHFDFTAVEDEPLRDWLTRPKIINRLTSIFETNLRRNTWRVCPMPGVTVLATLDRGWIASSGRRDAISELDLRLIEGSATDLYVIAAKLGERLPLVPLLLSKGERGCRLFLNTPLTPVKATTVALPAGTTPRAAFRLIALDCLSHMHLNHAGAISTDDPEYIHQMRVATRRLRAAMRVFKPVLPADFSARVIPRMRDLMGTLGRVRDLDVLMAEIINPVAAALPDEPRMADLAGVVTDRLYQARSQAMRTLKEPAYGRLLLDTSAWLHASEFADAATTQGDHECDRETDASTLSLRQFASRRLRRLFKTTLEIGSRASTDDPTSLHELRISIKRLRYAVEFFGPIMPGKTIARTVRGLARLQEELGKLNDLASAGALLMACAGTDRNLREAVALIAGWHGPRHGQLLAAVPGQLKKLNRLKLPNLS